MAQVEKSVRSLRVADEIQRVVAGVLIKGDLFVDGLKPAYIMITSVHISPDLSNATIYVKAIEPEDTRVQVDLLNANKGPFRKQIGRQIRLRNVPAIVFKDDQGALFATQIDHLLQTDHVKQDLD